MVLSTIDIGTNTILMVTLQREPDRSVRVLGDEHAIARLGKGVDAARHILPETFDRVAGHLERYRAIAESLGSDRIVAFGTSALRDAANREEFIAAMRERTGITIGLLSGSEEAAHTFSGALFGFEIGDEDVAVLDIGGGSTEVALGRGSRLVRGASVDVGAVRITERFLRTLPPRPDDLHAARSFARDALSGTAPLPPGVKAVGVAGTVTTLAAMDAGMARFDGDALNGTMLRRDAIERMTERLCTLGLDDIAATAGVHPDRADILPGGALILEEFVRMNDLPGIIVSTRGVRYGVAMHELGMLNDK